MTLPEARVSSTSAAAGPWRKSRRGCGEGPAPAAPGTLGSRAPGPTGPRSGTRRCKRIEPLRLAFPAHAGGRRFVLYRFPAEIFASIGLEILVFSPYAQTVVLGYTNGYYGYFPDAAAWDPRWLRGGRAGGAGGEFPLARAHRGSPFGGPRLSGATGSEQLR